MARSRRKTPIAGIACGESEKKDKQAYNRIHRRLNRSRINQDMEPVDLFEVSNPWLMSKDGKIPFNPSKSPKLMRK